MALCFDSVALPTRPCPLLPSESALSSLVLTFSFSFSPFWFSQSNAFEALTRLSHVVSGYHYSIVLHKAFVWLRILASCRLWTGWSFIFHTCCQSEFLEKGVIHFTLSWCLFALPDLRCLSLVQFTLSRRCGSRQRSAPGGGVGFFNLSCEVHLRRGRGWKFTTCPQEQQ